MGIHMKTSRLQPDENGMAAIFITVILMLVISLITLSFAQVTRREQRQSLDRQLAAQAFYAAESGVNVAQARIKSSGLTNINKTTCDESAPAGLFTPGDFMVNAASSSEVTCLLINSKVTMLNYQGVNSRSVPTLVQGDAGSTVNQISFSWQKSGDTTAPNCNAAVGSLPTGAAGDTFCNQPLLRIDLVPLGTGVNLSQAALQAGQMSFFLYPHNGAGATNAGVPTTGQMISTQCDTVTNATTEPYFCTANITVPVQNTYGVRIMSIYGASDVAVFARNAGTGGSATLINAQAVIDSTAKSQDVLRRVQARISLTHADDVPDFGLVSGAGLCKRYTVSGSANPVGIDSGGGADISACAIP